MHKRIWQRPARELVQALKRTQHRVRVGKPRVLGNADEDRVVFLLDHAVVELLEHRVHGVQRLHILDQLLAHGLPDDRLLVALCAHET
ncbi:MAG: hypothetical protein CMJ19_20170 [Phycisphaeraceae bacterium]|nr:hypothetical protein [Phycisphaeraceae bacterium]